MNEIRFSHDYMKLPPHWEDTTAKLIAVTPTRIGFLRVRMPKLLAYDTKFRGEPGNYALNFEDALLLTFVHDITGVIFTTIRSFSIGKMEYYDRLVFDTFIMERTTDTPEQLPRQIRTMSEDDDMTPDEAQELEDQERMEEEREEQNRVAEGSEPW